jgi:transposase
LKTVRVDSHTHNAQVERPEVVDTGRRRRWSEDEKLRIVAESLSGPRLVSATARRYGISTSLLFTWRRACRQSTSQTADNGFVPAVVVPDPRPLVPAGSGRIEIVLANRRRVIVDGGVDIAVLSQLVEALERR